MSNRNGKAKKKKHPIKEHFSISFINDNIIITHRFKKCKCFKITPALRSEISSQ